MNLSEYFKGKRVFLTGHTGFKGAWMLQILHALGADVKGFSLPPEHHNDLFKEINGDALCYASVMGDVRDLALVRGELVRFRPHYVFHLAAQPLVRRSYREPVDTFATNAMGTANILESLRALEDPCVALMITTDKVYENDERGEAFAEGAPLGGYDPYSASKAAAEIIIQSYRRSFFYPNEFAKHGKTIAGLRAGNVIGGGDRSEDRLIPDIVRAIESGQGVVLRNPGSVRPWQHVLEPVVAYLQLAAAMSGEGGARFSTAYNIGPERTDERTVAQVTSAFYRAYGLPEAAKVRPDPSLHEAGLLMLDNQKLKTDLGWQPRLNADEAIQWTAEWYAGKQPAAAKCRNQIERYLAL